jgi:hypothetical protein
MDKNELNMTEASLFLGISKRYLRLAIYKKELKHRSESGKKIFKVEDLIEWVKKGQSGNKKSK